MLLHNPNILEGVVLCHVFEVIFNKIIDILTEDIHIAVSQNSFIVLRIYYELKKEHEQQVEGLETAPSDFGAYCLSKLKKTISNADITVGFALKTHSRVQVYTHL